jgi:hypothetical protein
VGGDGGRLVCRPAAPAILTLLLPSPRGCLQQHGIDILVPLLVARNMQLLYEAAFCVWSLSLLPGLCSALEKAGVAAAAARLVRETMPTKVVRMAVGTLANLARSPEASEGAIADVAETHVPATVDALIGSDTAAGDIEMVRS